MSKNLKDKDKEKEKDKLPEGMNAIEYRLVRLETWEPWKQAREFTSKMRNEHNLKIMSDNEELSLALHYALSVEGANGWKLAGQDQRFGIILVREIPADSINIPDLTSLFAGDPTKVQKK